MKSANGPLRRLSAKLLGTLALLLALPQAPQARETIQWIVIDFPPFMIRSGPHLGSGSMDGLLDFLIPRLPEYDHELTTVSIARREAELKNPSRYLCTSSLYRTPEREKLVVFSIPALIHLHNRLVFLSEKADSFSNGQAIDLESLLKRRELFGGFISLRSYAPNIDPIVAQYAKMPNVVHRPLTAMQMFDLLAKREIDYTILFPHEAVFLAKLRGFKESFVIRPIAGTIPYTLTQVACVKGAPGEEVIARVNRILKEQRQSPEYRQLSERWYNEEDKVLIRKYYQNLLDATPPPGSP